MNEKLQNQLFDKYPKIFKRANLSDEDKTINLKITCRDGWYELIDDLCEQIQARVNLVNKQKSLYLKKMPKSIVPIQSQGLVCEADQVKEKFGGLRFYVKGGDDFIHGAISLAESFSYRICADCGSKKTTNNRTARWSGDWRTARCNNCKDKFLARKNK